MTPIHLLLHGPEFNLLGRRQPENYGRQMLAVAPSTLPDSEEA